MNNNWFTFLVDEKLKIPNDWIGNHKTTGLPTYKPLWLAEAHLLRWPYRTCSDGHIAPAQKRNCSIACNSLSTRLPVWFPDWQSSPFIKYNCAPHTCPFRLSPKPQTYPSVNMWKNIQRASRMPVHSCDSHKTTRLSTQAFFVSILHGSLQTCRHSYASPYPQLV